MFAMILHTYSVVFFLNSETCAKIP